MSDPGSMTPPYVPAVSLARWVTGLMVATVGAAWVAVGFDYADVRLIARLAGGEVIAPDTVAGHDFVGFAIQGVQTTLLAATAIAFLLWLYGARGNLRALGARKLAYTTSQSVEAWFIPILNLWRPYQVVCEIAKASDPTCRDPFAWKKLRAPRLIGFWWLTFLVYAVLELAALGMWLTSEGGLPRLQMARIMALGADLTAAISGSLACLVVGSLTDRQEEKRALQTAERAQEEESRDRPLALASSF